ncbi:MAG TPA: tryptophan--tRNA ligase [Rhodanobacteraceae bacterium]|jgi:tryptophanyl-tRNA synthetase|nr:tryptophan--tRNA ligase [Rhodanobacteraceae bacterium]
MKTRVLTGITTSGTPHLGNYVGAIRPAIAASRRDDTDAFFFLADYHALIKCDDPARVARSRLEIAATWLACGLDPQRVTFYRQSDIPEIPELTWMLTCVAAKGLMNRAHAYKAAVDANTASGEDPDAGINLGLYSYPVLMAADILIFNAHQVPVGRDQVQHIEMTRDIGQRFNHIYGRAWRAASGNKGDPFVLPEVVLEERVATLPGLDGRKMSKSYDNTVPLFEGGARATREAIAKIVTDSREPGEPKDPDSSSLYAIYRAFASDSDAAAYREALRQGLGWGEAKQKLAALIESELGDTREKYARLMAHPGEIEDILREGARKARAIATPLLQQLRGTVGLGALVASTKTHGAKKAAGKRARIVSFRDAEGFRFRLLSAEGGELLLSNAFADPKRTGEITRALLAADAAPVTEGVGETRYALLLDGARIATSPEYADALGRDAAIATLMAALESLRS